MTLISDLEKLIKQSIITMQSSWRDDIHEAICEHLEKQDAREWMKSIPLDNGDYFLACPNKKVTVVELFHHAGIRWIKKQGDVEQLNQFVLNNTKILWLEFYPPPNPFDTTPQPHDGQKGEE